MPRKGQGQIKLELYDLEEDPREFKNLAHDPERKLIREELAQQLNAGWRSARIDTDSLK